MPRIKLCLLPMVSIIVFLLALIPPVVLAADEKCLSCHGSEAIAAGGKSHLFIDAKMFTKTGHGPLGCVSCHSTISASHPRDKTRPPRVSCKDCHSDIAAEYGKSNHANFAQCTDCHDVHAVKSLHKLTGRQLNLQCIKCHDSDQMVASHAKWLPKSALHLDAMPCIACHTSSENFMVLLYPRRKGDGGGNLAQELRARLPALGTGNGKMVTLKELKEYRQQVKGLDLELAGVLMPEKMTHNYQTLDNRWDCTFCHSSGTEINQTSYLLLPDDEGEFSQRLPVEKGAILDLLYGAPDFYIMGASRSTAMNIAGLLIVCAGLAVPLVHGALRICTSRRRKHSEADAAAGQPLYFTPLLVRIWHWLNAFAIVTLCLTGLQLRFPDYVNIFGSFRATVKLHDVAGVIVVVSFCLWFIFYLFIGKNLKKIYIPSAEELKAKLFRQIYYYFFEYFRGGQNPHEATPMDKFNPLQKLSYLFTMLVFLPLMIITGLLLLHVDLLREYLSLFGGLRVIIGAHFILACIFMAFLFVHIYLSTMGHSIFAHMRQMWTGWENK